MVTDNMYRPHKKRNKAEDEQTWCTSLAYPYPDLAASSWTKFYKRVFRQCCHTHARGLVSISVGNAKETGKREGLRHGTHAVVRYWYALG